MTDPFVTPLIDDSPAVRAMVVQPPNVAPTDLDISNHSVAENAPMGTLVGTLSATDPNPGDVLSFELTDDAGGRFILFAGTQVLVAPGASLDFEAEPQHKIGVKVTDQDGLGFETSLLIDLKDLDEAGPPSGDPNDVPPPQDPPTHLPPPQDPPQDPPTGTPGTPPGTPPGIDEDGNPTAPSGSPDETPADPTAGTAGTPGGSPDDTPEDPPSSPPGTPPGTPDDTPEDPDPIPDPVPTHDVPGNQAPLSINVAPPHVTENALGGTLVGDVHVFDVDPGDAHTLQLLDDAGGRFVLNGTQLEVAPGAVLDYEVDTSHAIVMEATDTEGASLQQLINIQVNDVFEFVPPMDGGAFVPVSPDPEDMGLSAGPSQVVGPLKDFFGDSIGPFELGDAVVLEGAGLVHKDILISSASDGARVRIDADQDGDSEGLILLAHASDAGGFLSHRNGNDVEMMFVQAMPDLEEGQAVMEGQVTGVINQGYLTGDGATGFRVELQEGMAANANALGVYEVDAQGNIVDTRLLIDNLNADDGGAVDITGVEAGHSLGFFLVQDGAAWAEALGDQDALAFSDGINGAPAAVDMGAQVEISLNGVAQEDLTIFHSFAASLNPDGVDHVVSGADGSGGMVIGFEDMIGGDQDFQDAVFSVSQFDLA